MHLIQNANLTLEFARKVWTKHLLCKTVVERSGVNTTLTKLPPTEHMLTNLLDIASFGCRTKCNINPNLITDLSTTIRVQNAHA